MDKWNSSEVMESRFSASCSDELWMYESDSDGFFSSTVVHRPILVIVSVKDYGSCR